MRAFVSKYENVNPVSATNFTLDVSVTYFTDAGERISVIASAVLGFDQTIDQMRVVIAQAVVDSCDPSWGSLAKADVIMPAFVTGA